jgi:hypothetical protein
VFLLSEHGGGHDKGTGVADKYGNICRCFVMQAGLVG